MSTKYFILTKDPREPVYSNQDNQIVHVNRPMAFLLPEVNLDYYYKNGLFESHLIDWCKQYCKTDGTFLDIGAHTGTYSLCLAPYCHYVMAFEPQRMTYYALCGSVALSNIGNIDCYQVGLGAPDQVGQRPLNIRSHDGGGSSICPLTNDEILGHEMVTVNTLDDFLATCPPPSPIAFIKMDVEYNELNVLKGATQTLKKYHYPTLLLEVNADSDTNKELSAFLETTLNYTMVPIQGCDNMYLAVHQDRR
jgi:FkbM family methyltransferase